MNYAVYGKAKENLSNRVDIRLVNNEKDYLKWKSKPNFITHKIFDNNLVAIHKIKTTLTLSKPAYVGMSILEFSKVTMYEFYFDFIRNKYGNKSRLLFRETDSLMYGIETENAYDNFNKNKEMFDFSNYSAKSKYYDYSNALVVGKMIDEIGCIAIEEFVGLKPKINSILVSDSTEYQKANGVN